MSVYIFHGEQLSQKDNFIFDKIKKSIDSGNKVLYIVPEQYSFLADKLILEALSEKYSHMTETLNFTRMAHIVNKTHSPASIEFLDREMQNLILYKILKSAVLTSAKKSKTEQKVEVFREIILELKHHHVDTSKLAEILGKLENGTFLYNKLTDLSLVLKEYDLNLHDRYFDYEDNLIELAKNIEKNKLFADYEIFIDNFTTFSSSEYIIIKELIKNAKNTYFTLLSDNFDPKELGDLFYPTYVTFNKLNMLANQIKCAYIDGENDDFYVNLFSNYSDSSNQNPENITLITARNQRDEVRAVIDTVKNLVCEGHSYSDIAVYTGDLSVYEDIIEQEFETSNVPYFMDKSVPLTENPLCRLMCAPFDLMISNFSRESVLKYLKNLVFLYDNHEEICIFEEYLTRFNLSKKAISNPTEWSKNLEIIKNYKNFLSYNSDKINKIYNDFLLPVIESFNKNTKTGKNIFDSFRAFTKKIKLENTLKKYIETKITDGEIQQNFIQCYNTFAKILKNINSLIVDEEISLLDYFNLLSLSVSVYEVGSLPNTIDKITISDIERGRETNKKFVFIIGLNDGVTPASNTVSAYISDFEREYIYDLSGVELPTSIWKNSNSHLALYRVFISADEQLFLSRSERGNDGAKLIPSFVWHKMREIYEPAEFSKEYVNISELTINAIASGLENDEIAAKLRESQETDELLENIEKIKNTGYFEPNKRLINSKYEKQLNTSVSRLESYQRCGYSYFIRYILRIDEKETVSYDFRKTGTLVHNLIDAFSKKMSSDKIGWDELDEPYIDKNLPPMVGSEILKSFPDTSLFNPRAKFLIKKLNRIVKTSILNIKEHFIKGAFIPVGYEIEVSENGIPPLTIALSDGTVMQIFGKIDRADRLVSREEPDKLYIRIIDYKSSKKEFNFALIKEGIQLQLLTYLKAIIENGHEYLDFAGEILPGAAFYTVFDDSLMPFATKPASDEIAKELKKKFMLKGLILNDETLVSAIDAEFANRTGYKSEICDINSDKEGNFSLKNTLFLEQFKKLLLECEKTLSEIGSKIAEGYIPIKPYRYGKESGCDYCAYRSVCMFDGDMYDYNDVKKLGKDEYFKEYYHALEEPF